MSELLPVLETLVADVDAGRPAALCAVVRTKGSTPQAPGAAMLVRADMSTLGTLGGGCVEAEVRKRAFELMQRGESALLDYVLNHDYGWDDGLICGGRMTVAVMNLPASGGAAADQLPASAIAPIMDAYRAALAAARGRGEALLPVVVAHQGVQQEWRVRVEAPPTLLIAGAGHVGAALARLAVGLDFHVVVLDDRADLTCVERLGPGVEPVVGEIATSLRAWPIDAATYVVIVTRGHQRDHQALAAVIDSPACYVGLIGSRRKSRLILNDLAESGVPQERLAAVRTPIGLPIDAVTVPEIALSIAAELVQVRRGRSRDLVEGPFALESGLALAPPVVHET